MTQNQCGNLYKDFIKAVRGGGTVHWMKDNFVRFFFFRIKSRVVSHEKLGVFSSDLSRTNPPDFSKIMIIQSKHQQNLPKIKRFGNSEIFLTKQIVRTF